MKPRSAEFGKALLQNMVEPPPGFLRIDLKQHYGLENHYLAGSISGVLETSGRVSGGSEAGSSLTVVRRS